VSFVLFVVLFEVVVTDEVFCKMDVKFVGEWISYKQTKWAIFTHIKKKVRYLTSVALKQKETCKLWLTIQQTKNQKCQYLLEFALNRTDDCHVDCCCWWFDFNLSDKVGRSVGKKDIKFIGTKTINIKYPRKTYRTIH
jgi:hypothetical protein